MDGFCRMHNGIARELFDFVEDRSLALSSLRCLFYLTFFVFV